MTMQLTAITAEQFASRGWKPRTSYVSAAQANILPAVAAELAKLAPALPLGFIKAEDRFQLVAITSLQPGTNCFVAPDGKWIGDYVPAILRSYPFKLVKAQDRDESILCFDESSGLLVAAGQGEAFFDEAGAPSQAIKDVLDFLLQVESSRLVTQAAVDALQAAKLIQSWPLNLQQDGKQVPVEGLFRVDEAVLNALDDEAFLSLRKAGALPLAYAQMFSMNQLVVLSRAANVQARLREQAQAKVASPGVADLGFRLSEGGTFKFS